MHQASSSTSSSELFVAVRSWALGRAATLAWVVAFLAGFDLGVRILFPPLYRKPDSTLERIALYVNHGRSIEAKLRDQIPPGGAAVSALARAGWLDGEEWRDEPTASPASRGTLVAVYGMSFAHLVARELPKLDGSIRLRLVGAPGAPPSHSVAAYELDRGHHGAAVCVIGVLAEAIAANLSMTMATVMTEAPPAYTFPRYRIVTGELSATWPAALGLEEFRRTLHDPKRWSGWVASLAEHDGFYDALVFRGGLLENSALAMFARRAWAKRKQSIVEESVHDASGFRADSEAVAITFALLDRFAATAREDGRLPIVLLFNNRGYGDHLDRLLLPWLASRGIPAVTSSGSCPESDPKSFVADGHLRADCNLPLARQMLASIDRDRSARVASGP